MDKQYDWLVKVALLAVAVILLTMFAVQIFGIGQESADTTCATSVKTRVELLKINPDLHTELIGCQTRYADLSKESDKSAKNIIKKDFAWCERSFAALQDGSSILGKQQEVFCHVCAYYENEEPRVLEGLYTDLIDQSIFYDTAAQQPLDQPEPNIEIGENLAIIAFQVRTDEHPRLQAFYKRWMGGATGAVTSFLIGRAVWAIPIIGPGVAVTSGVSTTVAGYFFVERALGEIDTSDVGIIINELSASTIDELGCTVANPDATSWSLWSRS